MAKEKYDVSTFMNSGLQKDVSAGQITPVKEPIVELPTKVAVEVSVPVTGNKRGSYKKKTVEKTNDGEEKLVGFRMSIEKYVDLKAILAKRGITVQDYINELIAKDFKG